MFDASLLIPIAFFAMIAAIVLVPTWLKSKERKELQLTLRQAIEKNVELPAEVVETLSREGVKAVPTAAKDMRVGVVLLAIGLGIALMGMLIGQVEADAFYPLVGAAAIPGMIGLAFIVLSVFNKNKS